MKPCQEYLHLHLLPMASLLSAGLSMLADSGQPPDWHSTMSAHRPLSAAGTAPPLAPASTESGVKPQARAAASAIQG